MSNINKPLKPITEDNKKDKGRFANWVLNIWYYCPNCKTFQFPTKEDLDGTIAECKHCKQKIDYKDYISNTI